VLLLGEKYKFTKLELQRLKKKFNNIDTIIYKDKKPNEVIDNIKKTLNKNNYTTIVLNTKTKVDDDIIKYLTNLKFKVQSSKFKIISIEHFLEEYLHKCYIPENNDDLHYLDDIKPFTPFQYVQKRIIDYIMAVSLLILTSPILIYSRYRIKKESPGTSMFKQYRVGLNNKEFKCSKFRSMRLDAEKDGARFASQNDDRVFPWGNIMRKTRIDEIPQCFNVLKGDMHFIGPRAEWDKLVLDYEKEIPYYNQRHIVKPGITGWAQVMFAEGRNKDDTKEKLMYDLYYIKHWSLWLELKVIWKTILVVVGKKGGINITVTTIGLCEVFL